MSHRPIAKTHNHAVHDVEHETLVYNLDTDECYCLEGHAGTVWSLCDGTRTVDDLMAACGLAGEEGRHIILITLEQLRAKGLMEEPTLQGLGEEYRGMSRRAMLRRAALGAAAVPLVSAIVAPTPLHAQSSCVGFSQPCASVNDPSCCSGLTCVNIEAGPTGHVCIGCVPQGNPCTVGGTPCCGGSFCQSIEGVPICVPI
jgi:hypothetical protein